MEDDDYFAIIAELQKQLRDSGAEDIADERHYAKTDFDTGERKILEPGARLLLMLEAFERHLSLEDRRTGEKAMTVINQTVSDGHVEGVILETQTGRTVDLMGGPDLTSTREAVSRLIGRLREVPPPSLGFR
ncbi:hypothetical protein [Agrobacterium rosae]|uniref:Uncharacterized protein n=1 Tax=Agrobacterium rosae TaxID=1972867 RepID=A0A1R3U188_9HYPH|nr:hypothetical protein [Agrobacterium rosae]SCX34505.1 hypothetical protein DSM25559_4496 [Agrobacterium rosae]